MELIQQGEGCGPIAGTIYILTNPLMPDLCKIGMTTGDVETRMKQLFTSGVPVPFECQFAMSVPDVKGAEKLLHHAFGDHRVNATREFFRIDPERVRSALRLSGGKDVTPKGDVADDAADIQALNEAKKRQPAFKFSMIGLKLGTELVSTFTETATCHVHSDKQVLYQGKAVSLSAAALDVAHASGFTWSVIQGPKYWMWNGKTLKELQAQAEDDDSDLAEGHHVAV